MYCSPTLTADEFKKVHNGLCSLDRLVGRLEEVLHPSLYADLVKASNEIRNGMAGAYDQDQLAADRKQAHIEAFAKMNRLKSIWSVMNIENFSDPHPYTKAKFLAYNDHWGDPSDLIKIKGNTWGDLYKAADLCIEASKDEHHIFIEAFRQSTIDPKILFLATGS